MRFASQLSVLSLFTGFAAAYSGTAALYEPGLGACGSYNTPNDVVASVSTVDYANGANCFRQIKVTYNGKSVTASIVDTWPPYGSTHNLDLSTAAFQQLASVAQGQFSATWEFV